MSASATQFSVLAPAAASMPPNSVFRISSGSTVPRSASSIAGMVVTSSSSMTRGLVSATYARSVVRIRPGATRLAADTALANAHAVNSSNFAAAAQLLLQRMVDRAEPRAHRSGSILA